MFSLFASIGFGSSPEPEDLSLGAVVTQLMDPSLTIEALERLTSVISAMEVEKEEFIEQVGMLIQAMKVHSSDTIIIQHLLDFLLSKLDGDIDSDKACLKAFQSDPLHAILLLQLLSDAADSPHTRFAVVRILRLLLELENSSEKVQALVLTFPMANHHICSCVSSQQEVLRNEAILLLLHLCKNHEANQKIVVFEGTIATLFDIIDEEGVEYEGIIACDCLKLLHVLLYENQSNKNFFREMGYFSRIPKVIQVVLEKGTFELQNLVFQVFLDTLSIPLDSSDFKQSQKAALANNSTFSVCLGHVNQRETSHTVIPLLSRLLYDNQSTKSILTVDFDVVEQMIHQCLFESDPIGLCQRLECISTFFEGNSMAQQQSLFQSSYVQTNVIGKLQETLSDPFEYFISCRILLMLFKDNDPLISMAVPLESQEFDLFTKVFNALESQISTVTRRDHRSQVVLLQIISEFVKTFNGIQKLLIEENGHYFKTLLVLLGSFSDQEIVIKGLVSFILLSCTKHIFEFSVELRTPVLDVLQTFTQKIGKEKLKTNLQRLLRFDEISKLFTSKDNDSMAQLRLFDLRFAKELKDIVENFDTLVLDLFMQSQFCTANAIVEQFPDNSKVDLQVIKLKDECQQLKIQLEESIARELQMKSQISELQIQVKSDCAQTVEPFDASHLYDQITALQQENQNLLVLLATTLPQTELQ